MSSLSAPPTDHHAPESAPAGREQHDAIDLTHGGPPPELLDQMARADQINVRLRKSGRELSFALSSDGRSLRIELRERSGRVLRTLSLGEAIDIAEGGELPE